MELVNTEIMYVICEHCKSRSKTNSLDDFREIRHTYPPTIVFICPDCKDTSRIFNVPDRLLQHMVKKISSERGYNTNLFYSGQKVTT